MRTLLSKNRVGAALAVLALLALCSLIPRPDVLRLHVIAGSDQAADQAAKLKVRDAILAEFGGRMASAETLAQAYGLARDNLTEIQRVARGALEREGIGQDVVVELGVSPFPERRYDQLTYDSGIYQSLNVYIGPAAGANWWCVMFPPLCVAPFDMAPQAEPTAAPPAFVTAPPEAPPASPAGPQPSATPQDVTEEPEHRPVIQVRSRLIDWLQQWWPL